MRPSCTAARHLLEPLAREVPCTREKILLDSFLDLRWNNANAEQKSAVGRQCSLAFVTVLLGGPWVMKLVAANAGSASGVHQLTAHHSRFSTCVQHFAGLFNKLAEHFISPRARCFPSQTP
jgi:hypothetical protein